MADETQHREEQGPLPRSREAVDWWLKKWGRDAVVAGTDPLTREDMERLSEANGGTAEGLYLPLRDLREINLGLRRDEGGKSLPFNLQGIVLADSNLKQAELGFANLKGADLARSKLHDAGLQYANLRDTNMFGAALHGANLWEAELQGARLAYADLQDAILWEVGISRDTDLEGVKWDPKYVSVLERRGDYEAATAVYRRLKEWYRGVGMLTIAGEFHYREQEASHKAGWQRLGRQFKEQMAAAWRQLKGGDTVAKP